MAEKLFTYPTLKLTAQAHWLLTGDNGTGKSTFLEQLASQQLAGYYAQELTIGYFQQDLLIKGDEQILWDFVSKNSPYDTYSIRTLLVHMGFTTRHLAQPIKALSGGERVKAKLVQVLVSNANVLLLDEPTNYLDMRGIEALEKFVNDYPYALLFVSHDESFIETMQGRHFKIQDGKMIDSAKQAQSSKTKDRELLSDFHQVEAMNNSELSLEELQQQLKAEQSRK